MATVSQDKPTDAIAALLQERQRYEQWLAALESRRATTSSHVYARVYADYESRLGRVLEELGGRSAELRQVVETLTDRVNTLQTEENGHRDVRAEAELRAAVGEYSPEQWREVSQTSEADIARIAARRAEAASELAQVQQLLNMATATSRRPDAGAAAVAAAPVAAAPAYGAEGAAAQATGRPAPRASGAAGAARASGAAAAAPSESFDELAFLHSVVEPKDQGGAVPAQPAAPARASAPAARAKTPGAAAAVPPAGPPASPERLTVTPPDLPVVGESRQVPDSAGLSDDAPRRQPSKTDPVPLFLRDVPVEQIKTLKCAECGNMNYPTEWYCERCGGELAAM
jgi:Skp family chaperone for outer membrane proteins